MSLVFNGWTFPTVALLSEQQIAEMTKAVKCPYCEKCGPVLHQQTGGTSRRSVVLRCAACHSAFYFGDDDKQTFLIARGVYFLRCEAFVKIGTTTDLGRRLFQLEHGTPLTISPIGFLPEHHPLSDERARLKQFDHLRHRSEWFRADRELLEWVYLNTLNPKRFVEASYRFHLAVDGFATPRAAVEMLRARGVEGHEPSLRALMQAGKIRVSVSVTNETVISWDDVLVHYPSAAGKWNAPLT